MTEQYPSYSGPDETLGAPAPAGPPPRSTALAVTLMYVQAALSLIGLVITLLFRDSLKTALRNASPNSSQATLDTLLTTTIVIAVVVDLVLLVLYLLLSRQVAKGKNWARIVTVVLAALSVLGALSALAQSGIGLSRVLSVIEGIIGVALIVLLMIRPDSKAFFAARR